MSFYAIGAFITEYAGTIAVASAAIGVGSAVASADASRKAAHTNADIERQKADMAQEQAATNEDAQRRRGAMATGRAAAGAAQGSGLDGTNVDLLQQSATDSEIDALNIRYGGQIGALSSNEQANFSDMQADNATQSGVLNAGAAALSSAGSYGNSQRAIKAKAGPG